MPTRQQPRRIARELALLSQGQLSTRPEKLSKQELNELVLAAIRTLSAEIEETLEAAAAELRRGSDRLLESETRAANLRSAKAMVNDAIELTQTAINRLGATVELPEWVQIANEQEVRSYAIMILDTIMTYRQEIDEHLEGALIDWQLNRLPRVDRDLLRLAVAEILYLDIPVKVAINEAVELGKRYSDEEGYRFINGVLRRVSDRLSAARSSSKSLQ